MTHSAEIDPLELTAYVDGQLAAERRIAVERWLSNNPRAAADVMTDLQLRHELVLAHRGEGQSGSPETEALARRLEGRLARNGIMQHAAPLLAASLLLSIGWFGHQFFGGATPWSVPDYVTAAVDAHHTTELRTQLHLQTQPMGPDAAGMLERTQIKLPAMPDGWTVADIQLFPSEVGPSVEVAVNTETFGLVSIFAVHPGEDQVVPPETRQVQDTMTAYWQSGPTAYALVASANSADVTTAAATLFRSLQ